MERAEYSELYVLILTAVLLLSPQVSFARGMGGGAGGRAGSASFSSAGLRSAPVSFNGPRALAVNTGSRAFVARNTGRIIRPIRRSPFFPAKFRRQRIFINKFPAAIIVAPYQPFGFSYCNSIYFSAYDCPAAYSPIAPVYVPVPAQGYSTDSPYDADQYVSAPIDNRYYAPSATPRETGRMSSDSFDQQGDHAFRVRDYMTALRDWQHAAVDDPNNSGLAMKMALAMFAAGRYSEAAGTTQHALTLLPQERWGKAFRDYKKLYASPSEYAAQLKSLAKASADKPNDPALRFLLGFHYGYSDRVADAVRELDRLVQLEPKDQLGRKLRDAVAAKSRKDVSPSTAVASSGIYMRKDTNGTIYFSNVPADLKNHPTAWQRTAY